MPRQDPVVSATSPHAKSTWRQASSLQFTAALFNSACPSLCVPPHGPGIRPPVKEAEGDHGWKRPSCCLAQLPLCRWEDRSPLTKVIRFSGRPRRGAQPLGLFPAEAASLSGLCPHLDYANQESSYLLVSQVFKLGTREPWVPYCLASLSST